MHVRRNGGGVSWCAVSVLVVGVWAQASRANVFDLGPGLTNLEFVNVGYAGNAADAVGVGLTPQIGSVGYEYRIGTYEVTNAQYADFLNAKAASDPHELYHTSMVFAAGGITRTGSEGSYTYATIPGRENNPVNLVDWFDAARFVNWLHNGQGAGDTESGVYTFNYNASGFEISATPRSTDARYFLPTENEWYKAAYFQPASTGGDSDDYWLYPARSNTLALNESPAGANYFDGDYVASGSDVFPLGLGLNPHTAVGSYTDAATFFGAYDMGGNVHEFTENAIVHPVLGEGFRIRGGGWASSGAALGSVEGFGDGGFAHFGHDFGFRIAAPIPSPGFLPLLAALGIAGLRRGRGAARRIS